MLVRVRRSGVAMVAAAAAFTMLAAGWTAGAAPAAAAAVPTLPPLPSLPLPTPTPLPSLPLPSLPLPSLPIPPLPTPTALPLPSLPPGPLAPTPTPAPAVLGIPGSSGAAGGTLPPTASGGSAASTYGTTASVLGSLLGLLGAPSNVGVEQPSLEHFGSEVLPSSVDGAGGRGTPPGHGGPPVAWLALGSGLLVTAGVGLARGRSRWWRRAGGVAAIPAALILGGIGLAASAPAVHTTAATARLAAAHSSLAPSGAVAASQQVPAPGAELLTRIASLESSISRQAAELGVLAQPPAADAGRTPGLATRHSAAAIPGEQHTLATSIEATLHQEYDLFSATAQDPRQAAALVAAASTQPPAVRDAVDYDVQAVQAAQAQQAAIASAAQGGASFPVAGPAAAGSVPAGPGSPALSPPLTGAITQGFGPTSLAFEPAFRVGGVTYPHFHTGLDIAGPLDTPVGAAANGVVALAGSEIDGAGHLVGYGNYVVIAHGGGMVTLYGHLDRLLVQAGQAVHSGDPIGLEGSTGNSSGPHVHFEVRVLGDPVNPLGYLRSA
ncbi:MAG: M23 family metallopeptidase [Candidatus Dormibacteria bacterium]